MKPRKTPKLAPRNPLVAVAKFKKAGAHDMSRKACRRAEKMELQRESGGVAGHGQCDPVEDGFESSVPASPPSKRIPVSAFR